MAEKGKQVGTIDVLIYMGLPGEEPKEVGTVHLPLTIKSVSGVGFLDAQIDDVVSTVGTMVAQIWDKKADGE